MATTLLMVCVLMALLMITRGQQVVQLNITGTGQERDQFSSLKHKIRECEKRFLCRFEHTGTTDIVECIHMSRRCDGVAFDCSNNADEQGCTELCAGKVVCPDKKTCANVCDGVPQCSGQEDEKDCTKRCPTGQLTCADKKTCAKVCDGNAQCPNQRDEAECPIDCPWDSVQCNNKKKCAKKCDGVAECPEREDETSCRFQCVCTPAQYICRMGERCIDRMLICNGVDDCLGGDDEENCPDPI